MTRSSTHNLQTQRLEARLGYSFQDKSWLELALTHRSVSGNHNNERLEFLGDSILNFAVADFLYQQFPREKEGVLSRYRAQLVKQDTLAEVARDLALGDHLLLGAGELKSGGFRRESILADAVEAVLGGIYRDSGSMEQCAQCVKKWLGDRLVRVGSETTIKDSKSQLQELLQSRHQTLPVYEVIRTEGEAHNQSFVVSCMAPGLEKPTQGQGNSRRQAEQEAAAQALIFLGIRYEQ